MSMQGRHVSYALGSLPMWEGAGVSYSRQNQRVSRRGYKVLPRINDSIGSIDWTIGYQAPVPACASLGNPGVIVTLLISQMRKGRLWEVRSLGRLSQTATQVSGPRLNIAPLDSQDLPWRDWKILAIL